VLLAAAGARALLACGGLDADHDQPLWLLLMVDGEVHGLVAELESAGLQVQRELRALKPLPVVRAHGNGERLYIEPRAAAAPHNLEVGNVVVPCMAAVPGMVALRRSAVAVDRIVAAPGRAVAARPVAAPCRVVAAPCMSVVVAPYRMAVGSVPGKVVVVVVVAEVGRTVDHRPDVATGKSQLNPSH
jgi:hypothetical protein